MGLLSWLRRKRVEGTPSPRREAQQGTLGKAEYPAHGRTAIIPLHMPDGRVIRLEISRHPIGPPPRGGQEKP
jgi:hypothetical protein